MTTTETPTALDMARNWAEATLSIARHYEERERDQPGFGAAEARVNGAGRQQFEAAQMAAQMASFMALVSIAEDLHRLVAHLAVERIHRSNGDWLVCVCRNTPDQSGFAPCLPDGTEVEPVAGGRWGGLLYVCLDCGRIVNQDTLEVTGRRPVTS